MADGDQVLVGVDGGGSGCRVAVGTLASGILTQASGGPANIETDFEGALHNITTTVSKALNAIGMKEVNPEDIIAGIGVAGGNSNDLLAKASERLPYGRSRMTGDRETTVRGVLGDEDGYVIALGTGTIVARQADGHIKTIGGWGFQVSDQASGAWLGKEALKQLVLAEDGLVPHCDLTRAIFAKLGGNLDVFMFSGRALPKHFAELAPMVVTAAKADDPVACSIMGYGADYLSKGLKALGFEAGDRLSLSGGLGPQYSAFFPPDLIENLTPPRGSALDGAFALARAQALSMRVPR